MVNTHKRTEIDVDYPGSKALLCGFNQEGKFLYISLPDYSSAGLWLLPFFYPLDFGLVVFTLWSTSDLASDL